jgi:hypothetical protein
VVVGGGTVATTNNDDVIVFHVKIFYDKCYATQDSSIVPPPPRVFSLTVATKHQTLRGSQNPMQEAGGDRSINVLV